MTSPYYTELVCLNGHVISAVLERREQGPDPFCRHCGEVTISACPSCEAQIRGDFIDSGVISFSPRIADDYCYNCGKGYPWTDRAMQAVEDAVREAGELSEEEAIELVEAVATLSRAEDESSQAALATSRIKRIGGRLSREAYSLFVKVTVDVLSEQARRGLGGE